jgi:Flp pilus assembly protein TadG
MRDRLRDERGEATTEMVLIVPVLLLLVFMVIQFGLWYHANQVAEAAAQEGVRTARMEDGTQEAGQSRAESFMAQNGAMVEDSSVTVTRTDETARVEVNGSIASLVPGLTFPVHAEAESPVERFEADDR